MSDLLNGLGLGGSDPSPSAGTPGVSPGYQPPLHGTDPHGQGTVTVVDLFPNNALPTGGDPDGSDSGEEVVVGRSRGEEDGAYHGHVTGVALFGVEVLPSLLGADTGPGQTQDNAPLAPILTPVCTSTTICLTALESHSATTTNSSNNSFSAATVDIGNLGIAALPASVASADLVTSHGNISDTGPGGCQTSHGDSGVANATVTSALSASAANSTSDAQACSNGSQSQNNTSSVIEINGTGVPLPQPGCANGTPNSEFSVLGIANTSCNANDSNGNGLLGVSQAGIPYGVREALTGVVTLPLLGNILKVTTAASESRAVARAAGPATVPPTTNAGGQQGGGKNAGGQGGGGAGGGAGAAAEARGGISNLAFTGMDLLIIVAIGFGLVGAGLAMRRLDSSFAH